MAVVLHALPSSLVMLMAHQLKGGQQCRDSLLAAAGQAAGHHPFVQALNALP